jgi:hypothetical protein
MFCLLYNLVTRRGLQAVLGYPSFRATTDMLMSTVEATPLSSINSRNWCLAQQVSTILPALKAMVKLPGWRPRFIVMWIFFSLGFLIALPKLMDTMTRYV